LRPFQYFVSSHESQHLTTKAKLQISSVAATTPALKARCADGRRCRRVSSLRRCADMRKPARFRNRAWSVGVTSSMSRTNLLFRDRISGSYDSSSSRAA
jgi:hypothetical protein